MTELTFFPYSHIWCKPLDLYLHDFLLCIAATWLADSIFAWLCRCTAVSIMTSECILLIKNKWTSIKGYILGVSFLLLIVSIALWTVRKHLRWLDIKFFRWVHLEYEYIFVWYQINNIFIMKQIIRHILFTPYYVSLL